MSARDFRKGIDSRNADDDLSQEAYILRPYFVGHFVDPRFAFVCQCCSLRIGPGTGSDGDPLRHGRSPAKDGSFWPKHLDRSRETEVVIRLRARSHATNRAAQDTVRGGRRFVPDSPAFRPRDRNPGPLVDRLAARAEGPASCLGTDRNQGNDGAPGRGIQIRYTYPEGRG